MPCAKFKAGQRGKPSPKAICLACNATWLDHQTPEVQAAKAAAVAAAAANVANSPPAPANTGPGPVVKVEGGIQVRANTNAPLNEASCEKFKLGRQGKPALDSPCANCQVHWFEHRIIEKTPEQEAAEKAAKEAEKAAKKAALEEQAEKAGANRSEGAKGAAEARQAERAATPVNPNSCVRFRTGTQGKPAKTAKCINCGVVWLEHRQHNSAAEKAERESKALIQSGELIITKPEYIPPGPVRTPEEQAAIAAEIRKMFTDDFNLESDNEIKYPCGCEGEKEVDPETGEVGNVLFTKYCYAHKMTAESMARWGYVG